ncbi:MAG: hypothetical protein Q8Q96_00920 [bacterium]|nr:hypothetical protein [bacterium]
MGLLELFRGVRSDRSGAVEPTHPEEEICGANDDDLLLALLAQRVVGGDVLEFTTDYRGEPFKAIIIGITPEYPSRPHFEFNPLRPPSKATRYSMIEADLTSWRKVGHVEINKSTSQTTPPKSF